MKTKVYTIAFALLLIACSPDGEGENGGGGTSDALINPSTGWSKVGTIAYTASALGFEGGQAMTPYDLTSVGNELALIYSEDYHLTGVQGNNVFKVKFAPNAGNITGSSPLNYGGYANCHSTRFIPGSFTPVHVKLSNNNPSFLYECLVGSEESGTISGSALTGNFPMSPINWYADGGFTMAVKEFAANGNLSDAFSYTYPDVGNFTVTVNQWSLDPTHWIQTDALRLSGGEINQFIVSRDGTKLYFSIIKDDPSYVPTNGVQHDFFMQARQEIPGLNAENFLSGNIIIASNVVNDKYTVLLGEIGAGTTTQIIKKVHCYQWQKGTTGFTKLYGDIAVPEDVGTNFMFRTTIGTRPVIGNGAPVKFTPDGTAYMIYNYSPSNYVQNDQFTALATMNASGAKVLGKYQASDYPDGFYSQVGLGICEYYNGAYYAVVFQRNEYMYPFDDSKFRMEIVKLIP